MPAVALPPAYASEGWILDEDRALRDLMKGMQVNDHEERQRPVGAWFGHPDQEMREQKYPYVTVDLLDIQEGLDRVHRGNHYLADPPAWWEFPPLKPGQLGYWIEMPTPVDLHYQVATWSRNPRHDRQIITQIIAGERLPLRGGQLSTADGKIRRLDVLGHTKRDMVENGKRLLTNIFRVRVSSEYPWDRLRAFTPYTVRDIFLDFQAMLGRERVQVDEAMLTSGIVESWDPASRTATITLREGVIVDVPTMRFTGPYRKDDQVGLLKVPLTQTPSGVNDYRYLVLGINNRLKPAP